MLNTPPIFNLDIDQLKYDIVCWRWSNRFMVDYDIKQFFVNFVGATSWDDLDETDRKSCFRDYPKKSLPDWDEIEQESW